MIKLVDRDGDSVKMSAEDIAKSLRMMGNTAGVYILLPGQWEVEGDVMKTEKKKDVDQLLQLLKAEENEDGSGPHYEPVLQFHSCVMPRYSWLQLLRKRWRWERAEKKRIAELKKADNVGLIIEPRPFVLEKPWLRLKGNKAVTIYVD